MFHEKYLLIPNKINNIVDFREKFSFPCFKQVYWNLIKSRRFIGFYLSNSHLNIKMHSAPILMVLLTSSDINTLFYWGFPSENCTAPSFIYINIIPLRFKFHIQLALVCLGRFYNSGHGGNSCAHGSLCFYWQMETAVFVCSRRSY
jgi:hypothetical protein